MSQYRTIRTTTGRKYRMKMDLDEQAERELFRCVQVLLPFVGTVLLMIVWLSR